jgi:hypothetical protein
MRQVSIANRHEFLGPLPNELLQQLDSGDETVLDDEITAAVICALWGNQGQLMQYAARGVS